MATFHRFSKERPILTYEYHNLKKELIKTFERIEQENV